MEITQSFLGIAIDWIGPFNSSHWLFEFEKFEIFSSIIHFVTYGEFITPTLVASPFVKELSYPFPTS